MFNFNLIKNRTPVQLVFMLVLLAIASFTSQAQAEKLNQISLDANGKSTINAHYPFISTDGRFVVFRGSGLLPADTVHGQVYLYDRELKQLELVSVNNSGETANKATDLPSKNNAKAVSDDGRYVVFKTTADNLGTATGGIYGHVYIRDRLNNTTTLVSQNDAGDLENRGTSDFAMASDGWGVVFVSTSDNLDAADDDNDKNLYLRDLSNSENQTTKLACFNKNGGKINQCDEPALSCNGILTFESSDALAAADDINPGWDVFHGIPLNGNNVTVSVSAGHLAGGAADFRTPNISCDVNSAQTRIVYLTTAQLSNSDDDVTPGWDLYYYDLTVAESRMLRAENNVSFRPTAVSMSSNGEWIAIETSAALVPEDTNNFNDIYAFRFSRDRLTMSAPRLVSQQDGVVGNSASSLPVISDTGVVAFQSSATSFRASTDTPSGLLDIYVNEYEEILLDGFE